LFSHRFASVHSTRLTDQTAASIESHTPKRRNTRKI
jgi:hypothetical protein